MENLYFTIAFNPTPSSYVPFRKEIKDVCSELEVAMISLHLQSSTHINQKGYPTTYIMYRMSGQNSSYAPTEEIGSCGVPLEYRGITPVAVKTGNKCIFLESEHAAKYKRFVTKILREQPVAIKESERLQWRQALMPNATLQQLMGAKVQPKNRKDINNGLTHPIKR